MEELINSMKAIFKNVGKEDSAEKYLHFSQRYRPPVKVADW